MRPENQTHRIHSRTMASNAARLVWMSFPTPSVTRQRSLASHSNRPVGSAILIPVVAAPFTFAPVWKMSWTHSMERRLTVAKKSVVRKLGAFHLIASLIPGSTLRMICRTISISLFSGWSNSRMNSPTSPALLVPELFLLTFFFALMLASQSHRHFIEALLQALFGQIKRLIRLVTVF